jgi:adenylate cyclase
MGIHPGTVVAGEMGEFRRKITFLGNTLNVAARVEQIARDLGVDCIATAAAVERFDLPRVLSVTSLSFRQLRGKSDAMEIFQIHLSQELGATGPAIPLPGRTTSNRESMPACLGWRID